MTERPAKLPFAATLVLRAASELTLAEKVVWLEDHAFDRGPEGAYVSAASVAARWGGSIAPKTVECARNRLKLLGLHERIPRPGARNVFGWFSTLPPGCAPVTERPSQEEIARLAARLDEHLRRIGDLRLESGQTDGRTVERPLPGQYADHRPGSGLPGRGVGGRATPPFASPIEDQLPPVVEDGTGARAPTARMEPVDAATRRVLAKLAARRREAAG